MLRLIDLFMMLGKIFVPLLVVLLVIGMSNTNISIATGWEKWMLIFGLQTKMSTANDWNGFANVSKPVLVGQAQREGKCHFVAQSIRQVALPIFEFLPPSLLAAGLQLEKFVVLFYFYIVLHFLSIVIGKDLAFWVNNQLFYFVCLFKYLCSR